MSRIGKGSVVLLDNEEWVVDEILSLTHLRLSHPLSHAVKEVEYSQIRRRVAKSKRSPILALSDKQLLSAERIYAAIQPLIDVRMKSKVQVEAAAAELNCSVPSIYNYLRIWKKYQKVSALARKPRNDAGKSRLKPEVQAVINDVMDTYYSTLERRDIAGTWELIKANCAVQGLPIPSLTPVLSAMRRMPAKQLARARRGPKHVSERFEPYKGSFPNAEYPQAVYQIDHTPADVILVDEEHRQPIGRAYLTIVIDVCTRMLAGFCITLEAPSATSAALALSHAILPKEEWLAQRGIKAEWPLWGKPKKVHADNAKEFRGTALTRGCSEHGITLENRPKGRPQYGGTVERAFRTFMRTTQRLSGTTFGNTVAKLDYNSEKKAVLTLGEYERWFTIYVTKRYHQKKNAGIGYPPISRYKMLVDGTEDVPPIGLPDPINDKRGLLLDFLPYVERTIQQSGVINEGIQYWDDALRRWIGVKDTGNLNASRTFIFVFDPRDLSTLYFYDPELLEYFPIPYKNRANPPVSLWEVLAQKKLLRADPLRRDNEVHIFEGVLEGREIEVAAQATTNKTRRRAARKKGWESAQKTAAKDNKKAITNASSVSTSIEPQGEKYSGYSSADDIELPDFEE